MRALLDINVLIALLDADHTFHEPAHEWWGTYASQGWASCPITENGLVRIMSSPRYSERLRLSPREMIARLKAFAAATDHEFWADMLSLRDPDVFHWDRVHSSRQLTDIYLLALAAARGGRLVTFDHSIPRSAVLSARPDHLVALSFSTTRRPGE